MQNSPHVSMLALSFFTIASTSCQESTPSVRVQAVETAAPRRTPHQGFSYNRASPTVRWPHLQVEQPQLQVEQPQHSSLLTSFPEADLDGDRLTIEQSESFHDPICPSSDLRTWSPQKGHESDHSWLSSSPLLPTPSPKSSCSVEFRSSSLRTWGLPDNPPVADVLGIKRSSIRPNSKTIKVSKLALKKAKDWRQRVQRLAQAICLLRACESVADLMNNWPEQLNWTDMCFVLKSVGETHWKRALELYEWYNVKHWYRPNPRMLAGILSILGRAKQVSLAREIFDRGEPTAGNSVQVCNAMMGVYARHGNCEKTLQLLASMKEKGCDPDLITYNTVINARCKAGLLPGTAMEFIKDMVKDRLIPDVITYNTLISACAFQNDCQEAEKVFTNMKIYGCKPDVWTYNSMISVYVRSGAEDAAIELFEDMQLKGFVPDAVTYNSILFAYAKCGKVKNVDRIRSHMKEVGCQADEITYNTIICMYGKRGLLEKALSLYHEMRKEGCHPDAVTYMALVDMLGKSGLIKEAERVFEEMAEADIHPTLQAFSAMICAYAKADMLTEAQTTYNCMLETGIRPDNFVLCTMLNLLQQADLPAKAMTVYQRAIKLGCKLEINAYGSLLSWFSEKGLCEQVDILSCDMCSFYENTHACQTFVAAGLPEKAAELLKVMVTEGSSPCERLVLDILNLYCSSGSYGRAQSFTHSLYTLSSHLAPLAHQLLLAMLAKDKQVAMAKEEFESFRRCGESLSLGTYTSLISAFYNAEMITEVMLVYSFMQCFNVPLNEVCQELALSAYQKLSDVGSTHKLMSGHLNLSGVEGASDLYIHLIEEYGKQRLWERAQNTFHELQQLGHKLSVKAWNALIWAYANSAEVDIARLAVSGMIKEGLLPTSNTCDALLHAVINSGRIRDLHPVIQQMRQFGVAPSKNVFLAILDSLTSNGKVHLAKAVFEELKGAGYLPNMGVYKSLIFCFVKAHLVKDVESMIKQMESDHFSADIDVYNSLMGLYCKFASYRKAADLLRTMQSAGFSPDTFTYNSLICLYCRCLKVEEALAIVREMEKAGFKPESDSYTALISACGRLQMLEAAKVLFKDAQESRCTLNSKFFHAMMNAFRQAGQLEKAKEVLHQMQAAGIHPNLGTFQSLMECYGEEGNPEKAEEVLDIMKEAGFVLGPLQYTGMINAYLKRNDHEGAIAKLVSLKDQGFTPNYMVWTCMVSAASLCYESHKAIKLLTALADVGFSLPLRLLMEKSVALWDDLDHTLEELESCGQNAGLGVVNVLLDLLWGFQMQATAARVFRVAIRRNIYPSAMARVQVKDWRADLRRLSVGAALVAITLWLDQMQDAALQGFPESSKIVTITTGCNRNSNNRLSVDRTVRVYLWTMGSPFMRSKLVEGEYNAKGYSLRQWLKDSPHCQNLKLRNKSVLPTWNSMQEFRGAFMRSKLIPALQQIEECVTNVGPKKFKRLMNLTDARRSQYIAADIRCRNEMEQKRRDPSWQRKREVRGKGKLASR